MLVFAHAGHYALGLVEASPVLIVVVVAVWNSLAERKRRRSGGDVTPEGTAP